MKPCLNRIERTLAIVASAILLLAVNSRAPAQLPARNEFFASPGSQLSQFDLPRDHDSGSGESSLPCPGTCAAGIGCQSPDQQGHGAGLVAAATSDLNPNALFAVADNLQVTATGHITSICWWGMYYDFDAGRL
jgi:hypothetical protein